MEDHERETSRDARRAFNSAAFSTHSRRRNDNNNRKYTHHHYIIPLNFQNLRTLSRISGHPGTFPIAPLSPRRVSDPPCTTPGTYTQPVVELVIPFRRVKRQLFRIYDPDEINLIVFGRFASIVEIVAFASNQFHVVHVRRYPFVSSISRSRSLPGYRPRFCIPVRYLAGPLFASQTASC